VLLCVERVDGYTQEIPLDVGAGAGIAVQLTPEYVEPLPLASLTALELEQDDENPGLRASMGQFQRIIPLDPSSRILVGWEDSTAGLYTNHSRSESIVVSEIASLRLDFDRTVPGS
jgi:hypothetical protein